ncbi:manno(fructo)kinase [Citrobacter freundii]|nr:manno(fructo)kinase [Citrobacter freundii]
MRIGIDLGGTKTEVIALGDAGEQLFRHRLPTPRDDYRQTIETIAALVEMAEKATGQSGTVGMGIPGSISPYTGVVKNANSTWLNGQPFDKDLSTRLNREVRLANDANCLAVSEAVDGAAAGAQTVFAVIIGTGCGAGVALNGRAHAGGNGTAGEWGIIRCRGWMKTNCVIGRKCPVIAASKAVLKPSFPEPDLPLTTSV